MNPKNTLCLIVDIQERLLPALSGTDEMLERCRLLIQGLTALDVPFAVTEQYPKGLGNTVSAVSLLLPEGTPIVEKTQFSAFLPEIREILRKNDIKNVILVWGRYYFDTFRKKAKESENFKGNKNLNGNLGKSGFDTFRCKVGRN